MLVTKLSIRQARLMMASPISLGIAQDPTSKPRNHLLSLRKMTHSDISIGLLTSKNCYFYRSDDAYINMEKDYYAILQLDKSASPQQIKQSFYILAKKHHPDRSNGDESIFKELNEAYKVLSQPHLKKQYDQDRIDFQARAEAGDTYEEGDGTKRNINYGPYSQMSKAQWAFYRQGYMKQSEVDYTNFQRKWSPQQDFEVNLKEQQQWNRAYRSIKPENIDEQNEFRMKLFKKYKEDMMKIKQEQQKYYERKFNRIGERIQKFLGKRARNFFNKLVSK